jgi:putative CocE/NonD family hydrolase
VLEYIPYRKSDGTAVRDSVRHPWFAGNGYAAVRVDMRGSGDSEGVLLDEYLPQEQDDALEVLSWLAAQPWCTGAVGIFGKSWGGFNGLQIAARRPPELKAVISTYSTDDRYADDVHYMGGCVLGSDMLSWAATMLALNALPPDPAVVGERWRDMWLERLDGSPPFVEAWLAHQHRDDYWKHGSVCEDFTAIECPVFAVGGWADGYTNAVFRLLAGLSCPRKGLVGPWGHAYPEEAFPGPSIGFLQECLRWWDHWLKGRDTGVMDEPMLRVWIQEWVEPRPFYAVRPGRWVGEPSWPSPSGGARELALNGGGLEERAGQEVELRLAGSQTCGLYAGAWCPWGNWSNPTELPGDQRREDGLSLTFTSAPLAEPIELLGFPEVTLALASDRPNALVAVRLCDVAPDGSSLLVTRGLLNLTHRESHERPVPLEPGRRYVVSVRLNAAGQVIPAGHRLRVGVSPTYWPHAWPSPEPVTLTVFAGPESRLVLPVRGARPDDGAVPDLDEPEIAPPLPVEPLGGVATSGRTIQTDIATGRAELVNVENYGGRGRFPDGLVAEQRSVDAFSITEGDPLSATATSGWTIALERGDWRIRVETRTVMTGDRESFRVTSEVDAYEGNARVFARTSSFAVPRELV